MDVQVNDWKPLGGGPHVGKWPRVLVCGSYDLAILTATLCSGVSGAIPIKIFSLVIIVKIYESGLWASHCAGWFFFSLYVAFMKNSYYSYFIDEDINA